MKHTVTKYKYMISVSCDISDMVTNYCYNVTTSKKSVTVSMILNLKIISESVNIRNHRILSDIGPIDKTGYQFKNDQNRTEPNSFLNSFEQNRTG